MQITILKRSSRIKPIFSTKGLWENGISGQGIIFSPFGLLSDFDSERLVLRTLEPLSLGIKLDTGVELLGYIKDLDYAVSISQGVGRNRLTGCR